MGNIFGKKLNKSICTRCDEVLVIHFSTNHSLLRYIQNSEEVDSIEKYISSFFTRKNGEIHIPIVTTHLLPLGSSLKRDDIIFTTSSSASSFLTTQYRYFTFGENDETEEFVGSNLKRFSLIIICCDPPPFVFENVYVINSLETLLKDNGIIVASGFENKSYGTIGKRVIVVQDYPSSAYSSHVFRSAFVPFVSSFSFSKTFKKAAAPSPSLPPNTCSPLY